MHSTPVHLTGPSAHLWLMPRESTARTTPQPPRFDGRRINPLRLDARGMEIPHRASWNDRLDPAPTLQVAGSTP